MVVGFDNVGVLREEQGADVMKQLQQRFINMLTAKIRREDSLGHFAGSQMVLISPGTPYPACESFGNRLREAIHAANISVHGKKLNLSVSVGVSNSPLDGVSSAGALIELAGARLKEAQQSGGNRVIACDAKVSAESVAPKLEQAIALLNAGHESEVLPHLATLGQQILPLLKLIDRDLKVGLSVADIERKLQEGSASSEIKLEDPGLV